MAGSEGTFQENYHFCIRGYLREKGIRYFKEYNLQNKNGTFSISRWFYTDVAQPTHMDLMSILNKQKVLKFAKHRALLETINTCYWFPHSKENNYRFRNIKKSRQIHI